MNLPDALVDLCRHSFYMGADRLTNRCTYQITLHLNSAVLSINSIELERFEQFTAAVAAFTHACTESN